MTAARALILGLAGDTLSPSERTFFRDADPWGFIVFKRNIRDRVQLAALTASLRECVGRDAPVFVDQEGGRVQRLGPPHWTRYPPGRA
jgi:beta-N-acetylhexosaminidase